MNTFVDQRILDRIRAEYLEMPGMKLKLEQVQRLCGVERVICKAALDSLVKALFLCLKSDGTYVRLTEGIHSRSRAVKAELKALPATSTRRAS